MKRKSLKGRLLNLAKVAIAVGLIYWLFSSGRVKLDTFTRIAGSGWLWLGAALALIFININVTVVRFRLLLASQDIRLTYLQAFRLTFLGLFFNTVMPGSVGGDLIKAYYIIQESEERKAAAALTVFVDRFVGLAGLITVGTAAALFNLDVVRENQALLYLVLGVASGLVVAVLGFLVLVTPWFRNLKLVQAIVRRLPLQGMLRQLHHSLVLFRTRSREVLGAYALSLLAHTITVTACFALGRSLGDQSFGLLPYLMVVPLGLLIRSIPLTPGGIGLGEAAFGWLFMTAYGWPNGEEMSLLLYGVQTAWNLCGSYFYLANKPAVEKARGRALSEAESPSSETAGVAAEDG